MSSPRLTAALAASAAVLAACSSSTAPPKKPIINYTHPAGVLQTPTTVGLRPYGVAIASGLVLVTQLDTTTLASADAATFAVTGHVPVEALPTAVAFNPAGTVAYVANQGSGSIGVVNVATRAQVSRVPITGGPFNVLVSRSGAIVYATSSEPFLFFIDATSLTVKDSIHLSGPGLGLALNHSGSRLYVSDLYANTVREVNTTTHQVVRSFPILDTPQGLAVAPDSSRLYVATEAGYLSVVDLSSGAMVDTVALEGPAFDLAMTPDGTQLYVDLYFDGKIAVFDRTTLTRTNTLLTGGTPRRIAFNLDGSTAAIANEGGWVDFVR